MKGPAPILNSSPQPALLTNENTAARWRSLRRFTRRFAVPLWPWYLAGLVVLALTTIIALEVPNLSKEIVNSLAHAAGTLEEHRRIAIMIAGLGFLQILVRTASRAFIFWPGRRLEGDARAYYFDRAMRLPRTFFDRFPTGDLLSRLMNDVGNLRALFGFGLLQITNFAYLCVFAISKMASTHLGLTLFCMTPMVGMIILSRIGMPRIYLGNRAEQEALGKLSASVSEAFSNVHVIQANGAEGAFAARAAEESQNAFLAGMRLTIIRTLLFPLISSLTNVSQMIVLGYGGYEVLAGRLSVGDILAFNVYVAMLSFPLTSLGIIFSLLQRCLVSLERLAHIEATPVQSASRIVADDVPRRADQPILSVRNLNFSYGEERGPVLRDVSFDIWAGERIGVFGPVGSGKSTLFNLMMRLYDPDPGTIALDGNDVRDIEPAQLRGEIGYAMQTVHLFSDTLRANVAFGREDATEGELTEAVQRAHVLQDIEQMAQQWDTQIGEKGIRLSGGQKQRLALARLYLRKHRVLLIDDATSAVDQKTEQGILEDLWNRRATIVISSHRPEVLSRCDRIITMSEGRVVVREKGARG